MSEEDYTNVDKKFRNGLIKDAVSFGNERLSYVGVDCQTIPSTLAELYGNHVKTLDLSYNCLTSLIGVERFPHLQSLVLDNNCLTDGLQLPRLPHLHTLSINKNNIGILEPFLNQVSCCLPALTYLSLLGNAACPDQLSDSNADEQDYRAYRIYVLYRLPGLRFLDSSPVSPYERDEALCRGHLMRVIRPTSTSDEDTINTILMPSYTPLPSSLRSIGEHSGAYGKCRYRYSGKHSEGNRFIKNKDL